MAALLSRSRSASPPAEPLDPLKLRHAPASLANVSVARAAGGAGSRSARYVISTEEVDLMGDVVVQAGLRPVSERIPAQVDHSGSMRDLIGWWENIKTEGKRTLADLVLFPPTPDGQQQRMHDVVRTLHEAGVRMAASIGFVPDTTEGGYELLRDDANEHVTGIKFNRSTLVETSVVVVPANPGALSVRDLEGMAKSLRMEVSRLRSFVMTEASQRLLRGMPEHDARARAAAAVQKASAILERGAVK